MAAKKVLFWLGLGVINIDGKDYGAEMPLPVEKLDKDDLKKMIKDGRVGEKIAIVEVGCSACNGHLETIEAKNVLLVKAKEDVEELTVKVKEKGDDDSSEELAEVKKLNVELDSEVKRLTQELDEATKPAADVDAKTEKKDEKK